MSPVTRWMRSSRRGKVREKFRLWDITLFSSIQILCLLASFSSTWSKCKTCKCVNKAVKSFFCGTSRKILCADNCACHIMCNYVFAVQTCLCFPFDFAHHFVCRFVTNLAMPWDYITVVACLAHSHENTLYGNTSYTNINTSCLAIRSYLSSLGLFAIAEAPQRPKNMLSEEARKSREVASKGLDRCVLTRGCWENNQSYIVPWQASWMCYVNGTSQQILKMILEVSF